MHSVSVLPCGHGAGPYTSVLAVRSMTRVQVIFRHDAARVVQCCIQFGTPEQRNAIFEELKGACTL